MIHGPPTVWLDCVAERAHELLPSFMPNHLASLLYALSMLGCTASQQFMDDVISSSLPKLRNMVSQDVVRMATALANFGYRPTAASAATWDKWFEEFVRVTAKRQYDVRQVCDLVYALAALPSAPPQELMQRVLRYTRLSKPSALRHSSPKRLAALVVGLRNMGHKPDFGFMHSFAQGARFHWSSFDPRVRAQFLSRAKLVEKMQTVNMQFVRGCCAWGGRA